MRDTTPNTTCCSSIRVKQQCKLQVWWVYWFARFPFHVTIAESLAELNLLLESPSPTHTHAQTHTLVIVNIDRAERFRLTVFPGGKLATPHWKGSSHRLIFWDIPIGNLLPLIESDGKKHSNFDGLFCKGTPVNSEDHQVAKSTERDWAKLTKPQRRHSFISLKWKMPRGKKSNKYFDLICFTYTRNE